MAKAKAGRRGNGDGSVFQRCRKCKKILQKPDDKSKAICPVCGGKDAIWVGVVTVGVKPDGRPDRRTVYGQSWKEVTDKKAELTGNAEKGLLTSDGNGTFGEYLDKWLKLIRGGVQLRTWIRYESIVRLHIRPSLSALPLTKVTPLHLQELCADHLAAGRSQRTVVHIRAVAHAALQKAVDWHVLPWNPAALTKPTLVDPQEARFLTFEQAQRLIAELDDDNRLGPLHVMAILTGMRQGELCGLRWQDIDWENAVATVQQTVWWHKIPGETEHEVPLFNPRPKNKKIRRVALAAPLIPILRAQQDRQRFEAKAAAAAGKEWREFGLVFTRANGMPHRHWTVRNNLHNALRRAGLERIKFHELRHSAASLLLALGVPLKEVSEILGHSSIGITANLYGHLLPDAQSNAMRKLGDALFKPSEPSEKDKRLRG